MERKRHEERIVDSRTLESDETIEADVVVVGSGAGGAPVAHALAAAGHAVAILEEGGPRTRADFGGELLRRQQKLFRAGGATIAFGNTMIPIPVGRGVGGSTTVNSGTCFRTPKAVMRRWQLEQGLLELGPGALDPYFERVEKMLEVAPAPANFLGGSAEIIAQGASALGYAHGPLHRNAPACDGQGVCCFGCPTGAKRSTDVSYVPAALRAGAMLYSHARVDRILLEAAHAVGVVASFRREDGSVGQLTVRARTVVLSSGALHTPALLLRQHLANGSGEVGRNLTIHPASYAWAKMDHPVRGWQGIPQSYGVDEFVEQGIRFEGAFLPLELAASGLGRVGREWTDFVESFDRLACFGFMIADSSRGRVTLGRGRQPAIFYRINDADRRKLILAHAVLARMFLAAGARAVYPATRLFGELRSEEDVRALLEQGMTQLKAHHMDITAYHPLGTCRMGRDPRHSVVGPNHETHEVPGLFISDGSAVPGPLGVNPQVTIMALAERAAERVARRLERSEVHVAVPARRVEFAETMEGTCERAGELLHARFRVGAFAAPGDAGDALRLAGTIDIEKIATAVPCEGTLQIHPLRSRATLVYDLDLVADSGEPLKLRGEKHVSLRNPVGGMTRLHTDVTRRDGSLVTRGILRFCLRDLAPFLSSFRLTRAAS